MSKFDEAMNEIVKDRKFLTQVCLPADHEGETLDIIRHLRKVAQILDKKGDKRLKCLGLASNQLGYRKAIFVLKDERGRFQPWVNPIIHEAYGSIESRESCFSNLGAYRTVTRHTLIVVSDDTKGKRTLRGQRAIAFQHELDHLNGVLI